MSQAVRAFGLGLKTVLLAPQLVAGIALVMLATAIPFGLALGARVQASLAQQQPVAAGRSDIDAEWWMEYREHATGLEATFTPAIIGFAAPLDNLSALLDASSRPWALAGPVAISAVVWAFLWGGLLDRFARGRRSSLKTFVAAGTRYLPKLVLISLLAIPIYALIYLTVHAALFGPVYQWLAGLASSERDAFMWRIALYVVFAAVLASIALVVDYARITVVAGQSTGALGAIGSSARFVRDHVAAVVTLYLVTGLLMAGMLALYGASEIYGGTRVGGWRAVAIGQAYIIGRIALRLVLAASQVRLYGRLAGLDDNSSLR